MWLSLGGAELLAETTSSRLAANLPWTTERSKDYGGPEGDFGAAGFLAIMSTVVLTDFPWTELSFCDGLVLGKWRIGRPSSSQSACPSMP